MAESGVVKACASCGVDVVNAPRVKDKQGRYLCRPCVEKLQAARPRADQAPAVPQRMGEGDLMASLIKSSKVVNAEPCSQCGSPLVDGAVVCVQCGYHRLAGKVIRTQVARVGPAESAGGHVAAGLGFPGSWILASVLLSVLGGLLGTVLWYTVSRSLGVEISWVAIGVGAAAGCGAALGARGNEGLFTALIASAVALLAIGLAKYQVASAEYDEFVNRPADEYLAKEVLAAVIQEEAGTRTRVAPLGRRRFGGFQTNRMSDSEAAAAAEDVWRDEMTEDDRHDFVAELAATQTAMRVDPFTEKVDSVTAGLGAFDYLFGFLAIVAALGAGSGGQIGFGDD
ncbi:MAG TPA: hypothetical protein VFF69_14525 [Phycisphaerales bacterium]|nr:hypothetical protein [Phycisphaerales bacterium]